MCAVPLVLSFNQSGDSISDDAMSDQHLVTKFPVMLSRRRRGVVVSVLALHAGVLSSNRVLLPYSSILLFLIVVAEFAF